MQLTVELGSFIFTTLNKSLEPILNCKVTGLLSVKLIVKTALKTNAISIADFSFFHILFPLFCEENEILISMMDYMNAGNNLPYLSFSLSK